MKRIIDSFLMDWKNQGNRKPLLLRGARQVGKTHAARKLGRSFPHFVEINLESNEAARKIIEKDLDIDRIICNFLNCYNSPYGIRFWAHNEEIQSKIHLYPLYVIAKPLLDGNGHMHKAIKSLVNSI